MKTKRRILQIGIILVVALFTACTGNRQKVHDHNNMDMKSEVMATQHHNEDTTNMHNQHNSLANNFTHKDIIILDQAYLPAQETKAELELVIDAYIKLKDALAKDNEKEADKAVDLMFEKVAAVIPTKLEGKGLEAWKNHQALYEQKLKEMSHSKGLQNKRSYFNHISEIMYCTIKSFGLKQGNLFAVFCPMAFDNKGAYWISDSKEIQNPYMGAKMPTCGEIKEEL